MTKTSIVIRAFATARELLGTEATRFDLPPNATVGSVLDTLYLTYPDLERLPLAHAVNQEYADRNTPLRDGDELALIPPISGGSGEAPDNLGTQRFRCVLQSEPLDPRVLEQEARSDQDGAIATFLGVTRDHNDGAAVASLRYEAYEAMVNTVMQRVFDDVAQQFEIGRARIAHRLGSVPIGEASVVVVVAAPHRGDAFDACRTLMDRLKAEAPIFKEEHLVAAAEDGTTTRWIGNLPQPPDSPQSP